MKLRSVKIKCIGIWIITIFSVAAQTVDNQVCIPKGDLHKHTFESKIYNATVRDYWIYVPTQYDSSQAANLMIFQDGEHMIWGGLEPLNTLDSLISIGAIPVTIAVYINYGYFPGSDKYAEDARLNRSHEYDSMNDTYARFLEEEILPELNKKYNLINSTTSRAICGHSSGGICAWTVAWERPDLFSKVISLNGSFVNIKGGDRYPYLIRNTDPKPIKIFLFTSENDGDSEHGNWFLANQQMAAALNYAGYNFMFSYGDGDHHIKNAKEIFPEALRWIWCEK